MGIVSAKSRSVGILDDVHGYEDFIQTDAAINMGNSGGALVDAKGRLVGINSAIVSPVARQHRHRLRVPVNMAANVMKSLIETGTVTRGFLGVRRRPDLTPDIAEQVGFPKDAKGVIVTGHGRTVPRTRPGSSSRRDPLGQRQAGAASTSSASRSPRWRRAAR
jgi:S1-C subfamily serine protease